MNGMMDKKEMRVVCKTTLIKKDFSGRGYQM